MDAEAADSVTALTGSCARGEEARPFGALEKVCEMVLSPHTSFTRQSSRSLLRQLRCGLGVLGRASSLRTLEEMRACGWFGGFPCLDNRSSMEGRRRGGLKGTRELNDFIS